MNNPNITIKDVAKAANVSVATVSRVLNNKKNVSEEAIHAVNRAVEELGYSPNFINHDLHKSITGRILALICDSGRKSHIELLRGMQNAATAAKYGLLISSTGGDVELETRLLTMAAARVVDCTVLVSPRLDSKTLGEFSRRCRLAVCPERADISNVLSVSIDNERAAFDAVSYLIGKGRRRIAMITAKERTHVIIDRENGYRRALEKAGIPYDSELVVSGELDEDSGELGFETLMSRPRRPNALFVVSDELAFGAMTFAASRGITVGRDLLVFGFDNIPTKNTLIPRLSTVEQPWGLLGRTVIEKIIANLHADAFDRNAYILPHSLILRDSTGD